MQRFPCCLLIWCVYRCVFVCVCACDDDVGINFLDFNVVIKSRGSKNANHIGQRLCNNDIVQWFYSRNRMLTPEPILEYIAFALSLIFFLYFKVKLYAEQHTLCEWTVNGKIKCGFRFRYFIFLRFQFFLLRFLSCTVHKFGYKWKLFKSNYRRPFESPITFGTPTSNKNDKIIVSQFFLLLIKFMIQ